MVETPINAPMQGTSELLTTTPRKTSTEDNDDALSYFSCSGSEYRELPPLVERTAGPAPALPRLFATHSNPASAQRWSPKEEPHLSPSPPHPRRDTLPQPPSRLGCASHAGPSQAPLSESLEMSDSAPNEVDETRYPKFSPTPPPPADDGVEEQEGKDEDGAARVDGVGSASLRKIKRTSTGPVSLSYSTNASEEARQGEDPSRSGSAPPDVPETMFASRDGRILRGAAEAARRSVTSISSASVESSDHSPPLQLHVHPMMAAQLKSLSLSTTPAGSAAASFLYATAVNVPPTQDMHAIRDGSAPMDLHPGLSGGVMPPPPLAAPTTAHATNTDAMVEEAHPRPTPQYVSVPSTDSAKARGEEGEGGASGGGGSRYSPERVRDDTRTGISRSQAEQEMTRSSTEVRLLRTPTAWQADPIHLTVRDGRAQSMRWQMGLLLLPLPIVALAFTALLFGLYRWAVVELVGAGIGVPASYVGVMTEADFTLLLGVLGAAVVIGVASAVGCVLLGYYGVKSVRWAAKWGTAAAKVFEMRDPICEGEETHAFEWPPPHRFRLPCGTVFAVSNDVARAAQTLRVMMYRKWDGSPPLLRQLTSYPPPSASVELPSSQCSVAVVVHPAVPQPPLLVPADVVDALRWAHPYASPNPSEPQGSRDRSRGSQAVPPSYESPSPLPTPSPNPPSFIRDHQAASGLHWLDDKRPASGQRRRPLSGRMSPAHSYQGDGGESTCALSLVADQSGYNYAARGGWAIEDHEQVTFIVCKVFLHFAYTPTEKATKQIERTYVETLADILQKLVLAATEEAAKCEGVASEFFADTIVITFNAFRPIPDSDTAAMAAYNTAVALDVRLADMQETISKRHEGRRFTWGLFIDRTASLYEVKQVVPRCPIGYLFSSELIFAKKDVFLCDITGHSVLTTFPIRVCDGHHNVDVIERDDQLVKLYAPKVFTSPMPTPRDVAGSIALSPRQRPRALSRAIAPNPKEPVNLSDALANVERTTKAADERDGGAPDPETVNVTKPITVTGPSEELVKRAKELRTLQQAGESTANTPYWRPHLDWQIPPVEWVKEQRDLAAWENLLERSPGRSPSASMRSSPPHSHSPSASPPPLAVPLASAIPPLEMTLGTVPHPATRPPRTPRLSVMSRSGGRGGSADPTSVTSATLDPNTAAARAGLPYRILRCDSTAMSEGPPSGRRVGSQSALRTPVSVAFTDEALSDGVATLSGRDSAQMALLFNSARRDGAASINSNLHDNTMQTLEVESTPPIAGENPCASTPQNNTLLTSKEGPIDSDELTASSRSHSLHLSTDDCIKVNKQVEQMEVNRIEKHARNVFTATAEQPEVVIITGNAQQDEQWAGRKNRRLLTIQLGNCLHKGKAGRSVFQGFGSNSRIYAVKQILVSESASIDSIDKVQKEVRLMGELRNENIVRYISVCFQDSFIYIVMEFISGGSFRTLVQQFGCIPLGVIRETYAKSVLKGLKFLHEQGVVHRDISPNNVMVSSSGVCKLADFGGVIAPVVRPTPGNQRVSRGRTPAAARALSLSYGARQSEERPVSNEAQHSTLHLGVFGTPAYMSPEAARGVVDAKNDIWSLGITLCQCISGELPWTPDELNDPESFIAKLAARIIAPTLPDLSQLTQESREITYDFLMKCLEPNGEDRPSAAQLLHHPFII